MTTSASLEPVCAQDLVRLMEQLGRRTLAAAVRLLTANLLMCEYQPWQRGPAWISAIVAHRNDIESLIGEFPVLAQEVLPLAQSEYQRAMRQARAETGLAPGAFPPTLPFTAAQLLDHDFIPLLSGE
ncbi:DUF29 family protein [Massilia sp. CF038]|uniref:DUF29 family protein n=1 Tax=Massilia sp. CF038 TaxID=1881045 RepID=UPI00091A6920|nr:DUF29 family protein [Massilia sp. CF038]SHG50887.1 protein of unknown function DUF29 [Massilia sp. CF038]